MQTQSGTEITAMQPNTMDHPRKCRRCERAPQPPGCSKCRYSRRGCNRCGGERWHRLHRRRSDLGPIGGDAAEPPSPLLLPQRHASPGQQPEEAGDDGKQCEQKEGTRSSASSSKRRLSKRRRTPSRKLVAQLTGCDVSPRWDAHAGAPSSANSASSAASGSGESSSGENSSGENSSGGESVAKHEWPTTPQTEPKEPRKQAKQKPTKAKQQRQGRKAPQRRRARRARCRVCAGCRARNCGSCRACRDMPEFGGPGKWHLSCEGRRCVALRQKAAGPVANAGRRAAGTRLAAADTPPPKRRRVGERPRSPDWPGAVFSMDVSNGPDGLRARSTTLPSRSLKAGAGADSDPVRAAAMILCSVRWHVPRRLRGLG